MIKSSLPFLSRLLTFLLFFFALVFFVRGIAPLINNTLYNSHKTFIAWLLIDDQSDNQWPFPLFCWTIASGFLLIGILRLRKTARTKNVEINLSETTEKTRTLAPGIRKILLVCGIVAYLVIIGFLGLEALGSAVFNAGGTAYEDSLTYQGHVYLLSVAPGFTFEVSQCDTSGWFCHVIYDRKHEVDLKLDPYVNAPFMYAEVVTAHLQTDEPHHQLLILYRGEGTSTSSKLICPIP